MTINDYYVQKREVYYKLKGFTDILEKEGRALTAEEDALYRDAVNKLNEIQASIDTLKQMDEIRSSMNEPVKDQSGKVIGNVEERQIAYAGAVNKWMRGGMAGLTPDERKLINPTGSGGNEQVELRAIGTVANPSYTYATDVMGAIETAKRYYGGWLSACTELRTGKGNSINYPTNDDTSYTGALEAAGTDAFESSDAVTLGYKTLGAYIYSSQGVGVAYDALEDADFDLATAVGGILGERLWRVISSVCMTGDGSSKPQGLATAAAKGLFTGNCTINYARLIQFNKKLDWAYLQNPDKSGYMFHQSMFWDVMSLTATTGQPLWQPSMAAGAPSTFMGMRYWIANELTASSTVSAGSRHMLLGDYSKFVIRYAGPTILQRLNEAYAKQLQVGFMAIQRVDSELMAANATTYNPVKYLRRLST